MLTFTLRAINQLLWGMIKPLKTSVDIKDGVKVMKFESTFRCWPVDMDAFFHMNNAMIVRVAELSRWRAFPQTKIIDFLLGQKAVVMVAKNDAQYFRPVPPFRKYVVQTTLHFTDNKWVDFESRFIQHPQYVKEGKEPALYAIVNARTVLKYWSGKTVPLDELRRLNQFFGQL